MVALWLVAVEGGACRAATVDSSDVDTVSTVDSSSVIDKVDTLLFVPPSDILIAGDVTNPVDLETHLTQQPTVALFKSLLVPGLGQLGNRRYFKAALFAGLEGWFIGATVHYGRQANCARHDYETAVGHDAREEWYNLYDNKRKNRNKYAWFAGLVAFISMFDAYVDAHLSGSPTEPRNDQFTFDVRPLEDRGLAATVNYHF